MASPLLPAFVMFFEDKQCVTESVNHFTRLGKRISANDPDHGKFRCVAAQHFSIRAILDVR